MIPLKYYTCYFLAKYYFNYYNELKLNQYVSEIPLSDREYLFNLYFKIFEL